MSHKIMTTFKFALLAGVSLAAAPAFAQGTNSGSTEVEAVTVIGSQIKGAKVDTSLPVTVVTENDIIATGAVSGDELFRAIPQAGDVQFQEARTTGNLNDARGDVASLNLRSLGTGNTLMLLNGRRSVLHPGTQTENFVPVTTPNTNAIPVSGVKRVEVLRDGAAAIYGTDAVAGVVNTVLDTRFQGLRIELQGGGSEGTDYQEGLFTVKAGTKLDNGLRLTLFGSYTGRTRMNASERSYSASEDHRPGVVGTPWEGSTAFDNRSTSSPWGSFSVVGLTSSSSALQVKQSGVNLTASGVFHIEPVANAITQTGGCNSTLFGAGDICIRNGVTTGTAQRPLRYDENPDRTLRGSVERTNLFSTVEYDLTGDIQFYGELGYYHSLFKGSREQSAPLSSAPISLAANAYWNPFGPTGSPNRLANLTNVPTGGLALNMTTYRPVDTGPRNYTVTDDSLRLLGGLRGNWSGWDWDSAFLYSEARTRDRTYNAVSNTLFQRAVSLSTPDAYNPFNGGTQGTFSLGDATPNSRAAIEPFLINVDRISETSLALADFKVSNPDIFTLPAGPLGAAAGVEFRRETFVDDRDKRLDGTIKYTNPISGIVYGTDVMGASGSPDVKGQRDVTSAYIELAIPVVSPDMAIPLVEEVSVQLAARDEYYSDFGNVLKPKAAVLWKVGGGFALRGSVSQSFRAPNLPQFYSDGTTVSNTRTDWAACRINTPPAPPPATPPTCTSSSTLEVRSGNENLTPDEADNATFGFAYSPTFIPPEYGRLLVTADYWQIRQTDVIGVLGAANQISYDYLLRLRGSSNPNVVRNAPTSAGPVGTIDYVNDIYTNLQPRTVEGLDVTVDYDLDETPLGDFNLKFNVAQLLAYDQEPGEVEKILIAAIADGTLIGPTVASAGSRVQIDGYPEFRATATLTWRNDGWGAGLFVNHVGSVYDTGPAQVDGRYYELDAWTTVSVYGQYAFRDGVLDGSSVRVGVRNIEDKDPPLASNNFGYLGALHNATGRYWYATLSKRF
ncbi:TonB-dependent receptor domain-containing protein [Phenylobacterium sp.]|uniref:TonB-dependent receptor domain-containing protein n=1 Tax=Phenylobacterium sp. TaxID=1871053 RepID=UPI0037CB36C5